MNRGILLQETESGTAPVIMCDSCGERIKDYGMAWVMWKEPAKLHKPLILCKQNRCNAKPEYLDFASMELRDFLINLCRNVGMESKKDFQEALLSAHVGDSI